MDYTLLGIAILVAIIAAPLTYASWTAWNWLNTHMHPGTCGMYGHESMHEYCEEEHEEYMTREMVIEALIIRKSADVVYVTSNNEVLPLEIEGLWRISKNRETIDLVNSSILVSKYLEANKTVVLVIDVKDTRYVLREIVVPDNNLVLTKMVSREK